MSLISLGRSLTVLVFAGAIMGTTAGIHAAQIVYDGAETSDGYVDGSDPRSLTLTGPPGWGQWSGGNTGYSYVSGTNLTFSANPSTAGGAIQHSSATDASRSITHDISPNYTLPSTANFNLYASFLIRADDADTTGDAFAQFATSATSGRGVGGGFRNGNLTAILRNGSAYTPTDLGVTFLADTTYLFVFKLSSGADSWASTDPIEVWVNPTDVSSEIAMTDSALAHLASDAFTNGVSADSLDLHLTVANMANTTVWYDEFHMGTSLADVVPEPASAGLALVGLTGLLLRRKRGRS